jgi:phosphate transport system protein
MIASEENRLQSGADMNRGGLGRSGLAFQQPGQTDLERELPRLKEQLLLMASRAEGAVNRAVKALMKRDDNLARQTKDEDSMIDRLEMQIDETAIGLLERGLKGTNLRLVTMAMKIAHDLERVGDEATTISRRCLDLSHDIPLRHQVDIPKMAALALEMLKEAIDAFVNHDSAKARSVIPRDAEVDLLNKQFHHELSERMAQAPETIRRCLSLMVIAKSLERIADHATNIAEEVVYLYEGHDIRHGGTIDPPKLP